MPATPSCVPYNQPRSFMLLARAAQDDNERVPPLPAHHSPIETPSLENNLETVIVDIGPNFNDGGVDSVDIAIDPQTTEGIYRLPNNNLPQPAYVTSDNEHNQKILYLFILLALLCSNLQQLKTAVVNDCCNAGNVVRGGLNLMSLVILVILISFRFVSDVILVRHRERWYTYLVYTVFLLNIFNLAFS